MNMENYNSASSQRIDYIDALKGFLILSVVMCHVAGFCIGIQSDIPSFQHILYEFRNPPFFFISGFFAYKTVLWNCKSLKAVLKKKFRTIAWPTILFLAALMYIQPSHNGHVLITRDVNSLWFHWFTLSLFLFFIFYSLFALCAHHLKNEKIKSMILLSISILLYLLFSIQSIYNILPFSDFIKELFGMKYWGFFLFFSLGILARKHYSVFLYWLNNSFFIGICIILFFTFNLFYKFLVENHFTLFQITTYFTGIILVFGFFKTFPPKGMLKTIMVFTGKKTLDIYLVHYFLLPLSLYDYTSELRDIPVPILELIVTLSISIIIISVSLLISNITRLSPVTAFLIWGDNSNLQLKKNKIMKR